MKTTVLAMALVAAFSVPAFAEDAATTTDDTTNMTLVDPATTSATTTDQSDMTKTTVRKQGCMHGKTALQMM